jgi:hypothetical protein
MSVREWEVEAAVLADLWLIGELTFEKYFEAAERLGPRPAGEPAEDLAMSTSHELNSF